MYHHAPKLFLRVHPVDPFCIWSLVALCGSMVQLLGVYLGPETLCISGVSLNYTSVLLTFFTAYYYFTLYYKLAVKQ